MTVSTFALVAALVNGIGAGVVAIVSARLRTRRLGGDRLSGDRLRVPDLVPAVAASALVFVLSFLLASIVLPLDTFGLMHLTYLQLVVAVPLAALVALVAIAVSRSPLRTRVGRSLTPTRPVVAVMVVSALLAPLGFYMTYVEPYRLQVESHGPVTVVASRAGDAPIRIAVLTDYQTNHIGDYEVSAIDRLLAVQPHIILLPGDIFQGDEAAFERELPAIRAQLDRLRVPGGAFLVNGDTDTAARMRRMSDGTPVRFLDNEIVQTRALDRVVTIGGIELDYWSPGAAAVARELEARPGDDDIRILLSHRPDAVYQVKPGGRTDLAVSGHTHGGQVAVPFFGPLITMSSVPRFVAAGGLHELDGRLIYVGRGVGLERGQAPRVRLFVPPEIGVLGIED